MATLDPQAQQLLEMMAQAGMADFADLTPQQARDQMALFRQEVEVEPVNNVTDRTIPGPYGEIPVRIYQPEGATPMPALVFYHGGGWVIGDLEMCDASCRTLANSVPCVVVSVDYRLAPEGKFPKPLDDCYAALEWTAQNAASIGVDPNRVAVGGDSAGGNLAAAVAIRAREQSGPKIAHQLLIYPVTARDYTTASYSENGEGYMLTKGAMQWFWDHYLNSDEEAQRPEVAPLLVKDASGLPSATVITAGFDPLRDEGAAYAKKLQDAGVPVNHRQWDSMIHGFFHMAAALDGGREAVEFATQELKKSLSGVPA